MTKKADNHPLLGKKAPAFTLESSDRKKVQLSDFKEGLVVLYFYPKNNTPGCTLEAQEFRDLHDAFTKLNVTVLGVSPDSPSSDCRFSEKLSLNFLLLSDRDHAIAEKYGVWVEKSMCGKKYMGVERTTFLIGGSGKIIHVWGKVTAKGHALAVLDLIKNRA